MSQLTLFAPEPLASPSQLQDSEKDWMTRVATCRSSFLQFLIDYGPSGLFGRTSLASCQQMEGEPLAPSSEGWPNSGMAAPTESLMLSTSEFPSAAVVCSLSDILETGAVPQRYFLSARACNGILRRAGNRGKELPPQLARALQAVAGSAPTSTSTATAD